MVLKLYICICHPKHALLTIKGLTIHNPFPVIPQSSPSPLHFFRVSISSRQLEPWRVISLKAHPHQAGLSQPQGPGRQQTTPPLRWGFPHHLPLKAHPLNLSTSFSGGILDIAVSYLIINIMCTIQDMSALFKPLLVLQNRLKIWRP